MKFKRINESLDFNKQAELNGKIYNAVSDVLFDEKFLDVTENDLRNAFSEFTRKFFNESLNEDANLHPVPQNFDIVTTEAFNREFKRLKFNDNDLEDLKVQMKKRSPKASIGSGVYKFEWTPKRLNLGKGEDRVYYIELIEDSKVYLASIFVKKDKSDISKKAKQAIRSLADKLRGE